MAMDVAQQAAEPRRFLDDVDLTSADGRAGLGTMAQSLAIPESLTDNDIQIYQ